MLLLLLWSEIFALHRGWLPAATLVFALWWSVAGLWSQYLQNLVRVFGMCHFEDWQLSHSLKSFVINSLHTEVVKINSSYAGLNM